MIVRDDGDHLLLFRQPDHAHLSGDLAGLWGAPPWEVPEPFSSVVLGARLHDLAWSALDETPSQRGDGRPESFFEVDKVVTTAAYTRGVEAAATLDLYAGLLASLHLSGFFHGHWDWVPFAGADAFPEPEGAAVRLFVRDELARQAELRSRLDIDRAGPAEVRLAANYKWLQLWDRVSLDICRQDPTAGFSTSYPPVPCSSGPDAEPVELRLTLPERGRCVLEPYPLRLDPFPARLPVRRLPVAACADRDTFLMAWRAAAPTAYPVTFSSA